MARTSIQQTGAGLSRVARAARGLPPERRLAAIAAGGLFLSLFLPWYQVTVVAKTLKTGSETLTGWGAFSWVEAAVLLVSAGVLTLLFQRAEGRAFHVPGGDGGVIMAAGAWACVLVIWRIFDKPGVSSHGIYAASSGIEWGIFVALAMAALLAYAGSRIRAAHQPEPPLPGEGDRGPEEALEAIAKRGRERGDARSRDRRVRPEPARPATTAADARPGRRRAPIEQATGAAPGEGPLRRLFEDRPPQFERPQWSGSAIGAFDPRGHGGRPVAPSRQDTPDAPTRQDAPDAPTRQDAPDAPDAPTRQDAPDAPTRQDAPDAPTHPGSSEAATRSDSPDAPARQDSPEAPTRRQRPKPSSPGDGADRFPRPVAADQPPPEDSGRS